MYSYQLTRCSVFIGLVQVTVSVMWLHQSTQLPIQSYVWDIICSEDEQVRSLLPPPNLLLHRNQTKRRTLSVFIHESTVPPCIKPWQQDILITMINFTGISSSPFHILHKKTQPEFKKAVRLFASYFADKILLICHDFLAPVDTIVEVEAPWLPSGPVFNHISQLSQDEVDKVLAAI